MFLSGDRFHHTPGACCCWRNKAVALLASGHILRGRCGLLRLHVIIIIIIRSCSQVTSDVHPISPKLSAVGNRYQVRPALADKFGNAAGGPCLIVAAPFDEPGLGSNFEWGELGG